MRINGRDLLFAALIVVISLLASWVMFMLEGLGFMVLFLFMLALGIIIAVAMS
jgi:hypothetical protein